MGPLDYTMQVVDPIQAALQQRGLRFAEEQQIRAGDQQDVALGQGQQRLDMAQQQFQAQQAEAMRARQEQEAAAAQEKEGQRLFADFMFSPTKTAEGARAVIDANPAYAQAVMEYWQGQNADQQASELNFAKQFGFALNQSPDAAKAMLEDRAARAEAAGDPAKAAAYRAQAQTMAMGPDGVAMIAAQNLAVMAGVMEPKDLQAFMETAGYSQGGSLDDQKTIAEIEKIRTETAKINNDLANPSAGEDNFDREKKLRDEYTKLTGDYSAVKEAYRKISASDESAAGDLSLIFAYMKMLDPTSVVRETEFANAQNAAGIPDQVRNMWNKALSGERLNPDQRSMFKAQANGLMTAAGIRESEVRKGLEPVISQYSLNPENVFGVGGNQDGGNDDQAIIDQAKALRAAGQPLPPELVAKVREIMAKGAGQ